MTRQIALGAVVAFAVTVLALSVWEPKAVVVAPTPPPVVQPAPAELAPGMVKPFRPATLKPETMSRSIRNPVVMLQPAVAMPADAGSPAP